jgi:hypothetical protein
VREAFPAFASELVALLEEEEGSMLNLDVVNGRIMYVEVIGGPPLRDSRYPMPGRTLPLPLC